MKHEVFHYDCVEELEKDLQSLGFPLSLDSSKLSPVFSPVKLGSFVVKNRLLAQPVEGCDAVGSGAPSEDTIQRYVELAKGGYGTLWIESTAVCADGRTSDRQLFLNEDSVGSFKEMVARIRQAVDVPPYLVLQLTHSGRNSRPVPRCAYENPLLPVENASYVSDEDIAQIEDAYVRCAKLAKEAGFDAVDIRVCHGYLINELLSAYTREGLYGGSFENRSRMLFNIIDKTAAAVPGLELAVRLNVFDGVPYPYGWGCREGEKAVPCMDEPLRLIKLLQSKGIRLINITAGIATYSPYVIRPYDKGNFIPDEHPLEGIIRMLSFARQVKENCPEMLVVASALSWLREFGPVMASACIENGWFDIAGFGRQSIAYPSFPRELQETGTIRRDACCMTCGACTVLAKKGQKLRCFRAVK